MQPLLNIPENLILKNRAGVKELVKRYENGEWDIIDDMAVTYDFEENPVSFFIDDSWDLSAYIDAKISHKTKLTFTGINSLELIREFKLICFSWLYVAGNARITRVCKPTSIIARRSKLMLVYKYLDNHGFTSIEALNHPIIFAEYEEYLRSCEYSNGQLQHIFSCFSTVSRMNNHLPIEVNLPIEGSINDVALRCASPDKLKGDQYYAMPNEIMQKLYGYAIDMVNTFHPHKENIHFLLKDIYKNYQLGKKAVDYKMSSGTWSWLEESSHEYSVEVNKHKPLLYKELINSHLDDTPLKALLPDNEVLIQSKLSRIKVLCVLLCGAFTGMRRSELYGLHEGSFVRKEINGNTFYYLKSVMHKMTQGAGKKTAWITSPITEKAIELAEAINRHLSAQLAIHEDPSKQRLSSCLLLTQSHKRLAPRVKYEGALREAFKKISAEAGLYISESDIKEFKLLNPNCNHIAAEGKIRVGELWPITAHQFRRTFAVFAKRHNLCSDIAIKQQFKHIYLPMSEWYGEGGIAARLQNLSVDEDLKSLLDEVSSEITTQTVHQWYNSDKKLFGKMGQAISEERKYVATHFSSWEAIKKQVDKGLITLVGTLHSYCMAGYECKMEKVVSPSNCFSCENVVIDAEKALNWKERHKWICNTILRLQNNGELNYSTYSHFITQVRAAEEVMGFFKIPFNRLDIVL